MALKVTTEVHLAQELASNQKDIRDKALKKVEKWFKVKSVVQNAFTEDKMLTLWKGLHYYFWNCDKPLVQENIADRISKFIHIFQQLDCSFLYIDGFFKTITREWIAIDRYRLEKFMMLIRRILRQSFELLKANKFSPKCMKRFKSILQVNLVNPDPNSALLGLKTHITDIFMEELAMCTADKLKPKKLMSFLAMFAKVLVVCDNSAYASSITKDIFLYLINQDVDEEKFQQVPILKFNVGTIQKRLLKCAETPGIRPRNLKYFYHIVKRFQDYRDGYCIEDRLYQNTGSGKRLRKRDIERAAKKLLKEEETDLMEKLESEEDYSGSDSEMSAIIGV